LNSLRCPDKPGEPRSPVTPFGPGLPGSPEIVAIAVSPRWPYIKVKIKKMIKNGDLSNLL